MKQKRQNHPRLGNGMGSIKYLGKGRTCPYAVYPPEHYITPSGYLGYKKALCYVPDWYTGFAVLVSHKAGTYRPGDEIDIARRMTAVPEHDMDALCRKILSDYRSITHREEVAIEKEKHLFKDVGAMYFEERFGKYAVKKFSERTRKSYLQQYKQLNVFHDRYVEDITRDDVQEYVNMLSETRSKSSVTAALIIIHNIMATAIDRKFITEDPTAKVKIPIMAREKEHAQPYTSDELQKLWQAAADGDEDAVSVLIMVYSGFRISAFYNGMKVNLDNGYFQGGIKTGQNRIVPIHSVIMPFVKARTLAHAPLIFHAQTLANYNIAKLCERLGIEKHSAHSSRHTFKMLCDRYGVNPSASRVLMGHSTGRTDVHDAVYSHFELSDLKREIEKIDAVRCQ